MRIAIADNNSKKFTQDLIDYWLAKGHEVKYEPGASEFLTQWADIYYVDTWDHNIHYLYNLYHGKQEISPNLTWDNNKKPLIVCRVLDWEMWLGFTKDQAMINWVDKVICIAEHIETRLRANGTYGDKLRLIKPGVNLNKFQLKTLKTDGFQLGMVLGDMWKYKNHMGGLDIFTTLFKHDNRWRLHVRGQQENQTYDPINWDYYLESRGIKDVVTLDEYVPDINEWLEKVDILLHPGQKEAFCYAVGEAMAKGIPTFINDFYGSHQIWPTELLYQTHQEVVEILKVMPHLANTVLMPRYQTFIKDNYSLDRQLKETDEFIGI